MWFTLHTLPALVGRKRQMCPCALPPYCAFKSAPYSPYPPTRPHADTHTHTPPTRPGPSFTRGIVRRSRRERERSFWLQVARRMTHSDWGHNTGARLCSVSCPECESDSLPIFYLAFVNLGNTKTFEGKTKITFSLLYVAKYAKWRIEKHF